MSGELSSALAFPAIHSPGFQVSAHPRPIPVPCLPLPLFAACSAYGVRCTYRSSRFLTAVPAGLQLVTLASCSLAFLLNYTIFLNTALNSAVTQTICGNLKVKPLLTCAEARPGCRRALALRRLRLSFRWGRRAAKFVALYRLHLHEHLATKSEIFL